MTPNSEQPTGASERLALTSVANEIRDARRRAEEQPASRRPISNRRFHERRARAKAAVAEGLTRAQETWIGTRWYARSHRRLVTSVAISLGLFVIAAVAFATSGDDAV